MLLQYFTNQFFIHVLIQWWEDRHCKNIKRWTGMITVFIVYNIKIKYAKMLFIGAIIHPMPTNGANICYVLSCVKCFVWPSDCSSKQDRQGSWTQKVYLLNRELWQQREKKEGEESRWIIHLHWKVKGDVFCWTKEMVEEIGENWLAKATCALKFDS